MKYLSSLIIIFFFIFLSGCKDSGTQGPGQIQGNTNYPTNMNNEWEYQTVTTISYYNQSGGIDSTSYEYSDNSIIKVIKTDDTLKNYKRLIKFESYEKLSPENITYSWYLNSDTSFIAIAYYNPSDGMIDPKRNYNNHYLTLSEFKKMNHLILPEFGIPEKTLLDSIQYYDIPRKVLAYPLSVGNTWVELYTPFYRERFINSYETVAAVNQQFECFEIKVKWPGYSTEFNDYISPSAGLVKREIISDSVSVGNEYGDIAGFVKIHTTSTLTRKNF
jgi:hypothetical protein